MKNYFNCIVLFALMFSVCVEVNAIPDVTGKKKEVKGDPGTTITLVTTGTGNTKEEATKNALRSALEQTYGAFVSSNSQVVNDELIRDEIVSISTGNIVSYEELSFIDSNPKQVSVSAVVSISRLQTYAQNKGMSAELAGNTFAMNLKMEELNKKNQDVAMKHMLEQTRIMAQNLFDYELSAGNPEKTSEGVKVPVTIRIKANNNTVSFYDYFHKTLSSLAVQKRTGKDYFLKGKQGIEIAGWEQFDDKGIAYVLRGEPNDREPSNTIYDICGAISDAVLNCEIVDNLGNVYGFNDDRTRIRLINTTTGKIHSSGGLVGYRDDYKNWRSEFHFASIAGSRGGTYGFYFWMNAARPKAGEKLYEAKLSLMYTVDEIAKVSKIEVRPIASVSQKGAASPNGNNQGGWEAIAEKGFKLMENNKHQEAYQCFKQACGMAPNNAIIHGYAGILANTLAMNSDNIQNRKSLLTEAVKYLDKAKELDPTKNAINWGNPRYEAYKNLYGPDDERTKAANE